jgi:hypothetical protein
MLQVHWMLYLLFGILVCAILGVLFGTFMYCHEGGRNNQRAGWWAGVTLAVLVLADSTERFSRMPLHNGRVDVARVVLDSVKVSWIGAIVMALVCAGAMVVLDTIKMPEKGIAFMMLLASGFSLYAFVHVFWIRTANVALFSGFTGCCLGYLLYRAFLRAPVQTSRAPGRVGVAP